MKPDSNFILTITPNYAYGRRQGFTDGETYVLAEEAYSLMQIAEEKQIAKKPRYYTDNWGHNRLGCPGCPRNEILYAGQKYCSVCGTKIDWCKDHD